MGDRYKLYVVGLVMEDAAATTLPAASWHQPKIAIAVILI
jgi:hypothetical protein